MSTEVSTPTLLYPSGSPIAWLRGALTGLDEGLASLCRQHWQRIPRRQLARAGICDVKTVRIRR